MKTFNITKNTTIVCESQKTRYGFRHIATLIVNGNEIDKDKVCYYNRTWESFEFETVMQKLLEKTKSVTQEEKTAFFNIARKRNEAEINSQFKTVSMTASLGNFICDTIEEKNKWKMRMIKAGLPDIQIPEEWNTLDEKTKEKRLNLLLERMRE